jgi:hypothetical protein
MRLTICASVNTDILRFGNYNNNRIRREHSGRVVNVPVSCSEASWLESRQETDYPD